MRSEDLRLRSIAFATSPSCSPERCFPHRIRTTCVSASAVDEGSGTGVGVGETVGEGDGDGEELCPHATDETNGAAADATIAVTN
jgi:hypothetical protein